MKLGSLYTGLGMFDYAAEKAGIEISWQVEINEFCLKLLQVRYPNAKRFKDVKKTKGNQLTEVDIISGGFPCQPHSIAGKRKGGEDERNLIPDTLRIFDEKKPTWGLLENVYGILNTDDGKFFEQEVISPLESIGYTVQSYIIPASAIGAVHRRDRLWILANSNNYGSSISSTKPKKGSNKNQEHIAEPTSLFPADSNSNPIEGEKRGLPLQQKQRRHLQGISGEISGSSADTHPAGKRLQKPKAEKLHSLLPYAQRADTHASDSDSNSMEEQGGQGESIDSKKEKTGETCRYTNDSEFQRAWIEVAAKLCRVDASPSGRLLGSRHRKQRLEGLGNGIQWEIAYIFFEMIKQIENGKS